MNTMNTRVYGLKPYGPRVALIAHLNYKIRNLNVTGWDAKKTGICINGADTVIEWVDNNLATLLKGVGGLLVASAIGEGEYTIWEDKLYIDSYHINNHVAIKLTHYSNDDNGINDYSGRYKTYHSVIEETFYL